MKLISPKEGSKKIKATEMTIRNWVQEGKIGSYEDENKNLLVDKRELLEQEPTIITFYNQKGGATKTDSCVITVDYFETILEKINKTKNKQYSLLVIDLDPQATLSYMFFSDKELYGEKNEKLTLYNFFENSTPLNKIVRKYNDVIDLLPAHIDMLSKTNLDTTDLIPLKQELYTLFKKYTIVLIDCPPAINSFSRLGVLLGNYILCPLIATENCYRASASALKNIINIIQYNKDFVDYMFFLSSNSNQRTNIKDYIINKYKKDLKDKLFVNPIPDFVGVCERETIKKNIFFRYKEQHSSMIRIIEFMEQIENLIYDER